MCLCTHMLACSCSWYAYQLGVFACLPAYVLCMLSMLVLLKCFTYVVPCLVCLLSYVLYISIIKSKYSYIKEFVCIVTLNNFFIYILISYKKQHFETNFKEEEKSVTKLLNVFKRNINTATIQIFTLSMFFFFIDLILFCLIY